MIYQRRNSLHTRDRDIANMPMYADTEHKPFWRYIFAVVLFLTGVIVVGNLIEVMLP